MGHWSVDDLLKEIKNLDEIYSIRKGSELVAKMATQLESKVEHAGEIQPSILLVISKGIALSSLPDDIKDKL